MTDVVTSALINPFTKMGSLWRRKLLLQTHVYPNRIVEEISKHGDESTASLLKSGSKSRVFMVIVMVLVPVGAYFLFKDTQDPVFHRHYAYGLIFWSVLAAGSLLMLMADVLWCFTAPFEEIKQTVKTNIIFNWKGVPAWVNWIMGLSFIGVLGLAMIASVLLGFTTFESAVMGYIIALGMAVVPSMIWVFVFLSFLTRFVVKSRGLDLTN